MRSLGGTLLFAAVIGTAVFLGFVPRLISESGTSDEPVNYTIESLAHEPECSWEQTTRVTDDEDWIVRARGSDGTLAYFYVDCETHARLSVGQTLSDVPVTWERGDEEIYTVQQY